MALAQQTDILLLDEPTTFLDVSHQIDVLDLLTDLNRERGTTIVMVLHDLNLAARYADHLVAVADGRVHAAGNPADVLTAEVVRDVSAWTARSSRTRSPASRWCCRSAVTTPLESVRLLGQVLSSASTFGNSWKPVNVPASAISRATSRNPPQAARASVPPTLIRRTPSAAASATVMNGALMSRLTGLGEIAAMMAATCWALSIRGA